MVYEPFIKILIPTIGSLSSLYFGLSEGHIDCNFVQSFDDPGRVKWPRVFHRQLSLFEERGRVKIRKLKVPFWWIVMKELVDSNEGKEVDKTFESGNCFRAYFEGRYIFGELLALKYG